MREKTPFAALVQDKQEPPKKRLLSQAAEFCAQQVFRHKRVFSARRVYQFPIVLIVQFSSVFYNKARVLQIIV